jgi:DNA-binding beta-propeller fold protein YncE
MNGVRVAVTCAILALALLALPAWGQRYTDTPAPEFPAGMQWLNTDRPLTLRELRGKVVLLDFWTYACINCMHVIPDLQRLEEKYPHELVVIGVHSGKFSAERLTDNIRAAILRYGVTHPVVNDRDMRIWDAYGVQAWPTQVLIDPDGNMVYKRVGEGVFNAMDGRIAELVEQFGAEGRLDRTPLRLTPESGGAPSAMLSFPGKVLADAESGRLFIADSGHNRILVVVLADGRLERTIGSGKRGFESGQAAMASFSNPQGMALRGQELYVADTGNHAIRLVDLGKGTVETVAGTGTQAGSLLNIGGPGTSTALNSPWGLVIQDGYLYIAMAGSHQVWRMDLVYRRVKPWAGSGKEGRVDGPLAAAEMAQPSGITTDGHELYVADSESSSIRAVSTDPDGKVTTIAGGELFVFGDVDAQGLRARFQHPLGIAYNDGNLYVADTYNNKIKRVHIPDGKSEAVPVTGDAAFDEPGGLSIAGGRLYIADTNNHLVRVADLTTHEVAALEIHVPQVTHH